MAMQIKVAERFDFLSFLLQHRDKLGVIAFFLPLVVRFISQKAFDKLGLVILEIARELVSRELEDDARRLAFRTQILDIMPWWLTKFISREMMGEMLDNLYSAVILPPIKLPE